MPDEPVYYVSNVERASPYETYSLFLVPKDIAEKLSALDERIGKIMNSYSAMKKAKETFEDRTTRNDRMYADIAPLLKEKNDVIGKLPVTKCTGRVDTLKLSQIIGKAQLEENLQNGKLQTSNIIRLPQ